MGYFFEVSIRSVYELHIRNSGGEFEFYYNYDYAHPLFQKILLTPEANSMLMIGAFKNLNVANLSIAGCV